MAKKEPDTIDSTHHNSDIPLQSLSTDMPVMYRARQPPARLQYTWTSPFLNLRKRNQAKNNTGGGERLAA
ncbi:hypothetical protein CHS0354_018933 [Potamilus streckersoni]|uniref:Uncharacterized protein n=1 Tax=Potamilus streckersoni TaxID=2493646 RepID=A0AAE0RMQ6_9BIVA|nr:hypothetical protein CHS0354_018933 [Potamilus streckersoni]